MSKNMIFAQKLIKLLACQTCQNKKTPCMIKNLFAQIMLPILRLIGHHKLNSR